ncbi:MAG: Gfo/Idh/MocA family oxidoreductase [Bacteroidales bacterium]|nr:Gfo/Idh/MocA family oxidoreductase [Bacteroidales bacterium]
MLNPLKEIRWGIIGCGNVTEKKSGPAFNKVKGSSLVAVMRRSANLAEEYARRHGVPKWYADAEELISDSNVNAVYVATPPSSHADYAIRSMLAGKPVYVEKPMASGYEECQRMNEVATETGVPLFTAYYRRSLPYFLKVKELVDKEVVGKVMLTTITLHVPPRPEDYHAGQLPWRVIPSIAGGGYFYDLASHQIDLLDFLFGPIAAAYGRTYNRGGLYTAEDTVFATLEFENGIVAHGSWCFTVYPGNHYDKIEILGSDGAICFSTFQNTPVVITSKNKRSEYLPGIPENIQFYLIKSIVEELQGIGKCPSDGSNGERTNKVMDMILGKI